MDEAKPYMMTSLDHGAYVCKLMLKSEGIGGIEKQYRVILSDHIANPICVL